MEDLENEKLESLTHVPDTSESIGAAVEALLAKQQEDELQPLPTDASRPEAESVAPAEQAPAEPWAKIKHELRANMTRVPPESPLVAKMKEAGWEPTAPAEPGQSSWEALQQKLAAGASPPPTPPPEAPPPGPDPWMQLQEQVAAIPPPPPPPEPPPAPPPAPGPDWGAIQSDVQAAQRAAETRKTIAAMLQAAAPGFRPPSDIGDDEIAAARLPLEIERHRRETEAADRDSKAKLLEDTRAAALNDPNSPESKRAQQAYATRFGDDPRLVPAGLSQMSAKEIEKLTGASVSLRGQDLLATERDRSANTKAEGEAAKKAETDRLIEAERKSLEDERATLLADPRAKKLGLTPEMLDGLDRKGLNEVRKQVDSIKQDKPGGQKGPPRETKKLEDISDPGDRAKVQALLDGRMEVKDLDRKEKGRILGIVNQIDPAFDPTRATLGREVREKLAKSNEVIAFNTALEHFDRARKNIPKNFDTQLLNRLRRAILTGQGSPEMTQFEIDVKVAADEYAKALGNNAQAGREEIEHMFSAAQSPEQLQVALNEALHLLNGKMSAIRSQHQAYAPKGVEAPPVLKGVELEGDKPPLKTRPRKSGKGTAYQGRKNGKWYDNAEEAEAN